MTRAYPGPGASNEPLHQAAHGDMRTFAHAGYDVVRVLLGLLLLTATVLKGFELATEPVANTNLLTSRWFLIIEVEFEFLFGLWLPSGLQPRLTRMTVRAEFRRVIARPGWPVIQFADPATPPREHTCWCSERLPSLEVLHERKA